MSSLSINNTPGAMQSAQLGIQRGLSGLNRDAQVIANGGGSSDATGNGSSAADDIGVLTGALVDSLQQKLLVEASARMLSTVDETLGTLIDVKA